VRRRRRRVGVAAALVVASGAALPVRGLDLELYDAVLARHTREVRDVAGTRVDYAALREDAEWERLVASLAASDPAALRSREERLAFWINAYNVLAIQTVVQAFPVASIRDAGSLLRPVWKRPAGRVGGRTVTLDEIEHGTLRPLGDPRIHTAIVCASTSCPSLARRAYRSEQVEAQLDAAARAFVADRDKGVRVDGAVVRLSSIFDWFAADFAASSGVLGFVRRYAAPDLAAQLDGLGPEPPIEFFDYDWSLNGIR
jgi:hypothetical protein